MVFLLLDYVLIYFPLTSAPCPSASRVSWLFLFKAARKWGWEQGSNQPGPCSLCKNFAVELLTSRGQHKSVALHMLREALGFTLLQRQTGASRLCLTGATGTLWFWVLLNQIVSPVHSSLIKMNANLPSYCVSWPGCRGLVEKLDSLQDSLGELKSFIFG